MNKVILLSEKERLTKSLMDFATLINEHSPILLTGVFMPADEYWDTLLYYSLGPATPYVSMQPETADTTTLAIADFKKACAHSGIEYRVHEASYIDLKNDLRKETRFADLMLLSQSSFHYSFNELVNDEYTKASLHYAECPVIVVPEKFTTVKHIILTYDGSASSVYAIRQFAALFPQLASLDTLLVYVNPDAGADFPDKAYIEELAARHFPNLTLHRLEIDAKKYFTTWLQDRRDSLLVTGARGRRDVSELFQKSFISDVLQDLQLPLFIAHR